MNADTVLGDHVTPVRHQGHLARIWSEMGRAGQAVILGSALFATLALIAATTAQAYGASCAADVDMAQLGQVSFLALV